MKLVAVCVLFFLIVDNVSGYGRNQDPTAANELLATAVPTTDPSDLDALEEIVEGILDHLQTLKVETFQKYNEAVVHKNDEAAYFYNEVYTVAHAELDVRKELKLPFYFLLRRDLAKKLKKLDPATRDYIVKNWRKDLHKHKWSHDF